MSQYTIIDKKIHFLCEYRTEQETQTTKYVFWMAENELEIDASNDKTEIKLSSTGSPQKWA